MVKEFEFSAEQEASSVAILPEVTSSRGPESSIERMTRCGASRPDNTVIDNDNDNQMCGLLLHALMWLPVRVLK